MFRRLASAIGNAFCQGRSTRSDAPGSILEPQELREIEFESLAPGAAAPDETVQLLCPVTRQELRYCRPIYQCRVCKTSFSEAGWAFLRSVDHGRCCGCGQRKTVARLG